MHNRYQNVEAALVAAIKHGHESESIIMARVLIHLKCEKAFFQRDDRQTNLFQRALLASMPRLAKLMLEAQPAEERQRLFTNVNLDGQTSIHMAARGLHQVSFLESVFQFANRLPTDSEYSKMGLMADYEGYTPLHILVMHNRHVSVEWLMGYIAPGLKELYKKLDAHQLISVDNEALLARIKECETEIYPYINRMSSQGTVIHAAINSNVMSTKIVALLINYGADLYHAKNRLSQTGFDLLLTLPSNVLTDIFIKLHRRQQCHFLYEYENWLLLNDVQDKSLFHILNAKVSLYRLIRGTLLASQDSQAISVNNLLCDRADLLRECDLIDQDNLHFQYSYVARMNELINELVEWSSDLARRTSYHLLKIALLTLGICLSVTLLILGFAAFGVWVIPAGSLADEDPDVPGAVPLVLLLVGSVLSLMLLLGAWLVRPFTARRILSHEWRRNVEIANDELLLPLQQLERMHNNELLIPVEKIRELELALQRFESLGFIPPTIDTMIDMCNELCDVLKHVNRDVIRTNQHFSFFRHRDMNDEVRIEIESDSELPSDDEGIPLITRHMP